MIRVMGRNTLKRNDCFFFFKLQNLGQSCNPNNLNVHLDFTKLMMWEYPELSKSQ